MDEKQPLQETAPRRASLFPDTLWTELLDPIRNCTPEADVALNKLCQAYIPPLRAHLRYQGYDSHRTEDLLHEFLEGLIRRRSLETTDRSLGRFRTFLLVCLKNFLRNYGKPAKESTHASIDDLPPEALATAAGQRPDIEYEKAWAWMVVDRAIAEVEASYRNRGKEEVFRDLKGFLVKGEPGLKANEVAAKWGTSPDTVHRAIHDLRQRVRRAMREIVSLTVATSQEIDEELNYLLQILSMT